MKLIIWVFIIKINKLTFLPIIVKIILLKNIYKIL